MNGRLLGPTSEATSAKGNVAVPGCRDGVMMVSRDEPGSRNTVASVTNPFSKSKPTSGEKQRCFRWTRL